MTQPFSKNEKLTRLIIGALLLIGLFWNLGKNPLYLEEPRRAMIAAEMQISGNYLVPTQMGEFYYRKPPIFNWVILTTMRMMPNNPEFGARLVSVLAFLGIGGMMVGVVKKYHSNRLAWLSALGYLMGGHMLFYASMFAEIDIFYSLITLAGILPLYHFHKTENKWGFFLMLYGMAALGTLTKGASSPVFLVTTLGPFVLFFKRWRWLISPAHFAGIALFALLVGGFIYAYDQYNAIENYYAGLWSQASERTPQENPFGVTALHFLVFPFEVLRDTLPISLFIPFLFVKGRLKKLWQNEFLRFVAIMFLANILVYWISPGTRTRYLYMLYPLITILVTWLFVEASEKRQWLPKLSKWVGIVALGIILIAGAALPFVPQLESLPGRIWISLILVLLAGLSLFGIFKWKVEALMPIFLVLAIARIGFDLVALPLRAQTGAHEGFKTHGTKIAEITEGEGLWLYKYPDGNENDLNFGHVFYIEWNRQQIMRRTSEANCEDYFLALDWALKGEQVEEVYAFDYKHNHFQLVKFVECP